MVPRTLARTALSAAVTVALVGAPATLGVPAFGIASASGIAAPGPSESNPAPSPTETDRPTPPPSERPSDDPTATSSPDGDPDDEESHQAEDDASLPDGTYAVRKHDDIDTFALYTDGSDNPYSPDRPDHPFWNASSDSHRETDDRDSVIIPLPGLDPESDATRDFILVEDGHLNRLTEDGSSEPYAPGANDEGHRTFEFDVTGGEIDEVEETTPKRPEEDETEEPTPGPTDDPTMEPSPDPTQTEDPEPSPQPTDDPGDGDDRDDDGSDDRDSDDDRGDNGADDDGSGSDERGDGGRTEDPSTGNGSDDGGPDDPREPMPEGTDDWVPTGPQRPDYSDPVPQPPGAHEDDAITPDGEPSTPPADGEHGEDDGSDDVATDSASEDGTSAGMPWQIGVVVAIGAAAIGFILFVAGRRRTD